MNEYPGISSGGMGKTWEPVTRERVHGGGGKV